MDDKVIADMCIACTPTRIRKRKRSSKNEDGEQDNNNDVDDKSKNKTVEKVKKQMKPRTKVVMPETKSNMCAVCCSDWDKVTHLPVICPRCQYEACHHCHQRYLTETAVFNPHCMHCRTRWTYADLYRLFRQTFITGAYRMTRGQYLLDRAKSNIPLAMPYAPVEIEMTKTMKEVRELEKRHRILKNEVPIFPELEDTDLEAKFLERFRTERKINQLRNKLHFLTNDCYARRQSKSKLKIRVAENFEFPCPVNDCRGFINILTHKCELCARFVCLRCIKLMEKTTPLESLEVEGGDGKNDGAEVSKTDVISGDGDDGDGEEVSKTDVISGDGDGKNDGDNNDDVSNVRFNSTKHMSVDDKKKWIKLKRLHVCHPDDVESVKEIRKSSRACPNCKTRIFRISGCDSMWCTNCKTGFNWHTGIILTDVRDLHNPHYTDFLRQNPEFKYSHNKPTTMAAQQAQQNACDMENLDTMNFIDNHVLVRYMSVCYSNIPETYHKTVLELHRRVLDYRGQIQRQCQNQAVDPIRFALNYLSDYWSLDKWRTNLEHHDRFADTNQQIKDVVLTFIVIIRDLFNGWMEQTITRRTVAEFLKQVISITDYSTARLTEMSKTFKRKIPLIDIECCRNLFHQMNNKSSKMYVEPLPLSNPPPPES